MQKIADLSIRYARKSPSWRNPEQVRVKHGHARLFRPGADTEFPYQISF